MDDSLIFYCKEADKMNENTKDIINILSAVAAAPPECEPCVSICAEGRVSCECGGYFHPNTCEHSLSYKESEDEHMSAWISVKDRLPERRGTYITYTNATGKSGGVLAQEWEITTLRGKEIRRWKWLNTISPWIVTHWMPLPEPPKED